MTQNEIIQIYNQIKQNHEHSMNFKTEFKHETEQWRDKFENKINSTISYFHEQNVNIQIILKEIKTLNSRVLKLEEDVDKIKAVQANYGKVTIKEVFAICISLFALIYPLFIEFFKIKK